MVLWLALSCGCVPTHSFHSEQPFPTRPSRSHQEKQGFTDTYQVSHVQRASSSSSDNTNTDDIPDDTTSSSGDCGVYNAKINIYEGGGKNSDLTDRFKYKVNALMGAFVSITNHYYCGERVNGKKESTYPIEIESTTDKIAILPPYSQTRRILPTPLETMNEKIQTYSTL
jgi:hypothetical protein